MISEGKYYDVNDNGVNYGVLRCCQITKRFVYFASDECPWRKVCVLMTDLSIGLAKVEEV